MSDTISSLINAIYNLLTADATLRTAMGGTVRMYPVWAPPDATFPYLVHRIDSGPGGVWAGRASTYYLDIWGNGTDYTEILAIRQRIIGLLDQYQFTTTDVKNTRLELQTDGFIPESDMGIWHYAFQFNLYYWRQAEVLTILAR